MLNEINFYRANTVSEILNGGVMITSVWRGDYSWAET